MWKKKREAADPRARGVAMLADLVETALRMVHPGPVLRAPGTGGFDGLVLVTGAAGGWHLVTVGLSSPDVPSTADGVCGRGIELSLRVASEAVDPSRGGTPWPVGLLSALAVRVQQGDVIGPGTRWENRTPLDGDPASTATHLLFVPDRTLRRVQTPMGEVGLAQAVPVDTATLERARSEGVEPVVAELLGSDPAAVASLRPVDAQPGGPSAQVG
jgi:hypothetical protein